MALGIEKTIENWLQMSVVKAARPDDTAASTTIQFIENVLADDFQVTNLSYEGDYFTYNVKYQINGEERSITYNKMLIDELLEEINKDSRNNI